MATPSRRRTSTKPAGFVEALGLDVARHHTETQPGGAAGERPAFEAPHQGLRQAGAVGSACDHEQADVPDARGQQVGDDVHHRHHLAVRIDDADDPLPRERPTGRQDAVDLYLRLVNARDLAVDREEVVGIGVEEALQERDRVGADLDGGGSVAGEEALGRGGGLGAARATRPSPYGRWRMASTIS